MCIPEYVHLFIQLLKSLDDASDGVNILVVRLIENGGGYI